MMLRTLLFLLVLAAWFWQARLPAPLQALSSWLLPALLLLLGLWLIWGGYRKLRSAIRDMND